MGWHLEPMNIGQWYDIQICMKVIDSATDNGLITLTVDGNVVYEVDAKLIQYDNVKWYQSNPWDFDQTMEDKIEVKNMVVNDHEAICTTDYLLIDTFSAQYCRFCDLFSGHYLRLM